MIAHIRSGGVVRSSSYMSSPQKCRRAPSRVSTGVAIGRHRIPPYAYRFEENPVRFLVLGGTVKSPDGEERASTRHIVLDSGRLSINPALKTEKFPKKTRPLGKSAANGGDGTARGDRGGRPNELPRTPRVPKARV